MIIHLGIPQVLIIILYGIAFIMEASKHGKPYEGTHNVWNAIIGSLIIFSLLIWGGFFS